MRQFARLVETVTHHARQEEEAKIAHTDDSLKAVARGQRCFTLPEPVIRFFSSGSPR
jgi:hypothetical protein